MLFRITYYNSTFKTTQQLFRYLGVSQVKFTYPNIYENSLTLHRATFTDISKTLKYWTMICLSILFTYILFKSKKFYSHDIIYIKKNKTHTI